MGALNDWQVVDANNNAAPPDGWPENTMAYSDVNDTGRAVQGTIKRYYSDINGTLVGGGVADIYTVTLNETGYLGYFNGMIVTCSIIATNTIAAPTLNVTSAAALGATVITDNAGNGLAVGALQAGGIYTFQYDGLNFRVSGGLGAAVAGGSDQQVQVNDNGLLNGFSGLTFDDAAGRLAVTQLDMPDTASTITMGNRASADGLGIGRISDEAGNLSHFWMGRNVEVNGGTFQYGRAGDGACLISFETDTLDGHIRLRAADNDEAAGNPFLNGVNAEIDIDGSSLSPFVGIDINGTTLLRCSGSQVAVQNDNLFVLSGAFSEDEDTYASGSGTKNLDVSAATVFRGLGALSGAVTFTFDNPVNSGSAGTITIILEDAGSATITWPASVDWPSGTEPTWTSGIDIVSFVTTDGGTTWYGFLGGLDFS